jgi:hypothetical protein
VAAQYKIFEGKNMSDEASRTHGRNLIKWYAGALHSIEEAKPNNTHKDLKNARRIIEACTPIFSDLGIEFISKPPQDVTYSYQGTVYPIDRDLPYQASTVLHPDMWNHSRFEQEFDLAIAFFKNP